MANDPKSMSQDDIDALLAQVGAEASVTSSADAPAANSVPGDDPRVAETLITSDSDTSQQDAIDSLVAETTRHAANLATKAAAEAAAAKAAAKAAELAVKSTAATNKSVPTSAPTTAAQNPKPQNDIDHLLAAVEETAQHTASADVGAGAAAGPLGQEDIDKLLSELGANSEIHAGTDTNKPAAAAAANPSAAAPAQTGSTSKPAIPAAQPTSSATPATPAALAGPGTEVTTITGATSSADANATLALSSEDIDALVNKQVGVHSDHNQVPMIDQGDIDALVKQLSVATGAPNSRQISEALAKHEGEIDELLANANNPKSTMDAVDVPRSGSATVGGTHVMPISATTLAFPVMAPAEMRGTRWLLAAAVLFLAMSATTLMLVVRSIDTLSHELKQERIAQLTPSDSFSDDLKAALARLADADEQEAAKGVLFLQRLKKRYPSHDTEIAWALAEHFRSRGAHQPATEEFASITDNTPGLIDNPRLYLDYADSLNQMHENSAALRQIYALLANEQAYLGSNDIHNLPRPADEISRNQQAVQDAYLALGRYLSATWQHTKNNPTVASRDAATSNSGAHGDSHAAGNGHAHDSPGRNNSPERNTSPEHNDSPEHDDHGDHAAHVPDATVTSGHQATASPERAAPAANAHTGNHAPASEHGTSHE